MRITLVIDAPHYIGGIRYIERFIKILLLTEEKIELNLIYINCDSSIEANCPKQERFIKIPSFLYRIDRLLARFIGFSFFSFFLLKDVKNSTVFFSDIFLPKYFRIKNNIKVVHWFPDFQVYDLKHLFPINKRISRKLYIKLQLVTCDMLLTQSETDFDRMRKLFPSYSQKIVKWSFAEPYFNVPEEEQIVIKGNKLSRGNFLLYPHQGWAHKNHVLLIEAMQYFKAEVLVLTGRLSDPRNPQYSTELAEAIEKSSIPIINLGLVTGNELNSLMKNAKAVLNLSSYEGWSSCVEEASMLGTPLILSNIKIHLEQIPEAFFVDISNFENTKATFKKALLSLTTFSGHDFKRRLNNSVSEIKRILIRLKS
ncbi:MAG: glycosyltransferase [Pedobacter sp.]|nr:MAG: glycosyltransferase [Pedobacter sp.]